MSVRLCPKCRSKTKVYDSRTTPSENILRHRECMKCGFRFKTIEKYLTDMKKGGEPDA